MLEHLKQVVQHHFTQPVPRLLECEKQRATSAPGLAEGCGWRHCFGSETCHANLPLASTDYARKLIPVTQF